MTQTDKGINVTDTNKENQAVNALEQSQLQVKDTVTIVLDPEISKIIGDIPTTQVGGLMLSCNISDK